jgi:hypothetical protein
MCPSGQSTIYDTAVALSRTIGLQSEDVWRNLKIPCFEGLNATLGNNGWKVVPSSVAADDYSSLLGVPVVGLRRNIDMSFSLETTYLNTDCEPVVQMTYAKNWTWPLIRTLTDKIQFNLTPIDFAGQMPGEVPGSCSWMMRTFFFDTQGPTDYEDRGQAFFRQNATYSSPVVAVSRKVVFGSIFKESQSVWHINLAKCDLAAGGRCHVTHMRESILDQRPKSVLFLDIPS